MNSTHITVPRAGALVLLAAALLTALWFADSDRAESALARRSPSTVGADPDEPPDHGPPITAPVPSRELERASAEPEEPPRGPSAGSIVVRVVDPDGAPVAGFPLRLWRGGPFPDKGSEERGVKVPATDSNGESRIAAEARELSRAVEIAPAAPLVGTPGVAIPRSSEPSAPLVLRVPHTASVLVRVLDQDGTPVDAGRTRVARPVSEDRRRAT